MNHSISVWGCEKCGVVVNTTYKEISASGPPFCCDCFEDMAFISEKWIETPLYNQRYHIGDSFRIPGGGTFFLVMFDEEKDKSLSHFQLINSKTGDRWSRRIITHDKKTTDPFTTSLEYDELVFLFENQDFDQVVWTKGYNWEKEELMFRRGKP